MTIEALLSLFYFATQGKLIKSIGTVIALACRPYSHAVSLDPCFLDVRAVTQSSTEHKTNTWVQKITTCTQICIYWLL